VWLISTAAIAKRTLSLLKATFFLPASFPIGKVFRGYGPAINLFPVELWARGLRRVLSQSTAVWWLQVQLAIGLDRYKAHVSMLNSFGDGLSVLKIGDAR
jgi:hypothetical protein